MISQDSEYSMLKQEIISLVEIQNTYIIAMYTITITIFGIAFERRSHVLFLLPYIILFPFQRVISAKQDGIARIAAYISVYLEQGTGWESFYEEVFNRTTKENNNREKFSKLMNIITGRISSLQLAVLSSISSIIMCCYNKKINIFDIKNIKLIDSVVIIGAILLFAILYYWTKGALKSNRKKYIKALENLKLGENNMKSNTIKCKSD